MQAVSTPLGEPLLIQLNNNLLNISETGPNQINICFDELSENLRHQVKNYQLKKINYKTIVSSLKGQHPNILKASLSKNPDQLYVLMITVTYQFLPEINQQIIFSKREIKPEQSQEIAVNNLRNYMRNLKEQVKILTNIQVLAGQFSHSEINQTYFPITHSKSLIHWTLKLKNPSSTILKAQLYYYNTVNRKKQSSQFIPEQGVYLYYAGSQCNTQMRFIVEQSEKYDSVCLQIKGKYSGNYIISIEKVSLV